VTYSNLLGFLRESLGQERESLWIAFIQ
jgi:hypothetical protein